MAQSGECEELVTASSTCDPRSQMRGFSGFITGPMNYREGPDLAEGACHMCRQKKDRWKQCSSEKLKSLVFTGKWYLEELICEPAWRGFAK